MVLHRPSDDGWQGVDAIDLTLDSSSPEPEQAPSRPRHIYNIPTPQANTSTLEHRYSRTQSDMATTNVAAPNSQFDLAAAPPKPINPAHLRKIINATDHQLLQETILELCRYSPALGGAIARKLAPRSLAAHSSKGADSSVPSSPVDSPAPKNIVGFGKNSANVATHTGTPSLPVFEPEQPAERKRSGGSTRPPNGSHPTSSHQTPQTRPTDYSSSASNSDKELRLPTSSMKLKKEQGAGPTPLRGNSESCSAASSSRQAAPPSHATPKAGSSIKLETKNLTATTKLVCQTCRQVVTDSDGFCMFHPESLAKSEYGHLVFTCCRKMRGEEGCEIHGTHDVKQVQVPSPKTGQKRPSPDRSPNSDQKRAKPTGLERILDDIR